MDPAEIPGGPGEKARPDPAAMLQPGAAPGPTASPMSTPQPNEGLKQSARVQVQIARRQLEQALPALGSDTDEGRCVLSVLSKLAGVFGKTEDKDRELIPAEIASLVSGMEGTPGAAGAAPGASPAAQPAPAMA